MHTPLLVTHVVVLVTCTNYPVTCLLRVHVGWLVVFIYRAVWTLGDMFSHVLCTVEFVEMFIADI